jgi:hypothetical protein
MKIAKTAIQTTILKLRRLSAAISLTSFAAFSGQLSTFASSSRSKKTNNPKIAPHE